MKKYMNKIVLIFIMGFLCLSNIKATTFDCIIAKYTITFDDQGNVVGAIDRDGENLSDYTFETVFHPKKESECPGLKANISRSYKHKTLSIVEDSMVTHTRYESCNGYMTKHSCENNKYYSCIWNETEYGNYCNTDSLVYVYCGGAFDIPRQVPGLISFFVNLLKIATPIILIIISIISLLKALAASKEDEIKKAQKSIVTKIIAAVIIFFTVSIVQFVIIKVADSSEVGSITNCLSCFLNNDCESSAYYKTSVYGKYECTYLDGMKKFDCLENELTDDFGKTE